MNPKEQYGGGRVGCRTTNYWSYSIQMRLIGMSSTARSIPTRGQKEKNFASCFIYRGQAFDTHGLRAMV
jgi:hypothetical protein